MRIGSLENAFFKSISVYVSLPCSRYVQITAIKDAKKNVHDEYFI